MARITLRQLLDHAAEHGYGVPAYNMNNMEQGLAIMAAAEATRSPVILQASRGARAYAGDLVLAHMIDGFVAMHPEIPVCMHQDHGSDEATCVTAIQHGFTSVMMDGSLKADGKTPADYAYNVGHYSPGHRHGACLRRVGRGRDRRARQPRERRWRAGGRSRRRGRIGPRPAADRPGRRRQVRGRHQGRRAGGGHGHEPRRLQVHPTAGRRCAGDARDRGDPPAPAGHASGDAWLAPRCRRTCRRSSTAMAAR